MAINDKLRKLLVANFGRSKNNPVKQGKVISEYEKLSGVRHGGDRKSKPQTADLIITQDQIAKELGCSVDTLQRLKQISKLIPEIQHAISNGDIKYTVATSVFEIQEKILKKYYVISYFIPLR